MEALCGRLPTEAQRATSEVHSHLLITHYILLCGDELYPVLYPFCVTSVLLDCVYFCTTSLSIVAVLDRNQKLLCSRAHMNGRLE